MTRYVIPHPMPTSEQRRDAIRDLIARGQPLGASHVPEIKGEVFANGSVAMLSRGEYRVPQETLDHYGPELLERINAMPLEDNRDRYGHLLPRPDAVERSHAAKSASQGLFYGGTMKDSVVRDVWMHSKNYCDRKGNRATENCLFLADGRSVGLDDRLPRNSECSTNDRASWLRHNYPRTVSKNPLLSHAYNHVPSRLSDGTDISRMTADEIAVHQRRLSPKYPTLVEAAVLRRIRRRHFILRAFWVLAVIGLFAWVLHVS